MIRIAARASLLSRAQVQEVLQLIQPFHPALSFEVHLVETTGDRDQVTSLKTLDKTDFFTKEIDQLLIDGDCRIAIHSAKDLPQPLREGLAVVALTKGVDSADVLVLRDGQTLATLPWQARIGTSCERRERSIQALRADLKPVDIRGAVDKRLAKLDTHEIDGVVMAEAALIRLGLTHRNRIRLESEVAPNQGRLAIVARADDAEMADLFRCLDKNI